MAHSSRSGPDPRSREEAANQVCRGARATAPKKPDAASWGKETNLSTRMRHQPLKGPLRQERTTKDKNGLQLLLEHIPSLLNPSQDPSQALAPGQSCGGSDQSRRNPKEAES